MSSDCWQNCKRSFQTFCCLKSGYERVTVQYWRCSCRFSKWGIKIEHIQSFETESWTYWISIPCVANTKLTVVFFFCSYLNSFKIAELSRLFHRGDVGDFPAIFCKGDNFGDSLFTSWPPHAYQQEVYSKRKEHIPCGASYFLSRWTPMN